MSKRIWSIAKGALIASAGAALVYLSQVDFGQFGPVIGAIASIVINALYQLVREAPRG